VGTAVPDGNFADLLNVYRQAAGIATPATVITVARGGQQYVAPDPGKFSSAGERSLDVGVVTAIAAQSPMVVYAGSGTKVGALSNGFTAYQSAFWDTVNNPEVVTSSFGYNSQSAPNSPWSFTTSQLFIDAALRNITVFNANGD